MLAGTALGCAALPSAASAQDVQQTSAPDVRIESEQANSIYGRSTGGNVWITSNVVDRATGNGAGIWGDSDVGSVRIESNQLTTRNANSHGMFVEAPGAVTIDSGRVSTLGSGSTGIVVFGGAGNVVVTTRDLTTAGANSPGIWLQSTSGDISLASGTLSATGANSGAINLVTSSGGDISVLAETTTSAFGRAISASANGGGDIFVQVGSARGLNAGIFTRGQFVTGQGFVNGTTTIIADEVSATGGNAIIGQGATVNITSGTASGIANPNFTAATIYVSAGAGGANVQSGTVTSQGYGQWGIQVFSTGDIRVDSGSVSNEGDLGQGINLAGNRRIDLTSGSVSTNGAQAHGIVVRPYTVASGPTDVTIVSGSVTTAGANSDGIQVRAGGNAAIATGDVSATGRGLYAAIGGDLAITIGASDSVSGGLGGVVASTTGDSLTFANAGTVSGVDGYDAVSLATGRDANSNPIADAETVTVTNDGTIAGGFGGIFAAGDVSFVNSGTISQDGGSAVDLQAYRLNGADSDTLSIANSGTIDGGIEVAQSHVLEATIVNSGTIRNGSEAEGSAFGFTNSTNASSALLLRNSGEITSAAPGGFGFAADVRASGAGATVALSIENEGTIASTGSGYDADAGDAVNLILAGGISVLASAEGGASVDIVNRGTIAADGSVSIAVAIDASQVRIANGGTIRGAAGAIQTIGSVDTILNSGTIVGNSDLAALGDRLENSGTINGDFRLGAGDDVAVLRTGSTISGVLDGGADADRLELVGTAAAATDDQVLTRADGFEALDVTAGYWTNAGVVGAFDTVTIAAAAALELRQATGQNGSAVNPISSGSYAVNGLLVLDFDDSAALSTFTAPVSGVGRLALIGEGVLTTSSDLLHSGGTLIANGGLVLNSSLGGDVETAGDGIFTLTDASDFQGDLVNNGITVADIGADYDFGGAISGTGSFVKRGGGTFSFLGDYAFQGTTTIKGGAVRIAGTIDPSTEINLTEGALDISGTNQTIAELAGAAGTRINIANGSLTVDQDSNTAYAGSIVGAGTFTKAGTGLLNLTGTSTYAGPTFVTGGTLAVNGSIVSPVQVGSGAKLGGTGTTGTVTIAAAGRLAPGNSIGTLNVNGNVGFAANSIYEVEVNAAGQSDRTVATGTATISAGTVQVLAEAGTYRPRTDYTILTAQGGVTGQFASVTSNLAFLTPVLRYGANNVALSLYRNDINFADVAASANQARVAAAAQTLGIGNAVYEAVLPLSATQAVAAYEGLSGEALPGISTALVDQSRLIRGALIDRGVEAEGISLWARADGSWGHGETDGFAELDFDHQMISTGLDFANGGFVAGVAGGMGGSDLEVAGRASSADVDTNWLGAYAGFRLGGITGRVGLAYAWHQVETTRTVAIPGLTNTLEASFDADTRQYFAEIGYAARFGGLTLEPFAGYRQVSVEHDGFAEAGGASALNASAGDQDMEFLTVGARLGGSGEVGPGLRVEPTARLAWQRGWGDRQSESSLAFASGGRFAIQGLAVDRDSVEIDAGLALRAGRFSVGASYSGSIGDNFTSHGGRVSAGIRF